LETKYYGIDIVIEGGRYYLDAGMEGDLKCEGYPTDTEIDAFASQLRD